MFSTPKNSSADLPDLFEALTRGPLGDVIADLRGDGGNSQEGAASNPMQSLLDNLLDRIGSSGSGNGQPQSAAASSACSSSPAPVATFDYEIVETPASLLVTVDMPGVDKASIQVTYESPSEMPGSKKTLNITSERKGPLERQGDVVKSTIKYGKRAIGLLLKKASQSITSEDITASFENGVLTISVPRENKAAREPRYVHIA